MFEYRACYMSDRNPRVGVGMGRSRPLMSLGEFRSWKSHASEWFNTFLNAHTMRSKPFFPCSMEGLRSSNSTATCARQQKLDLINRSAMPTIALFRMLPTRMTHGSTLKATLLVGRSIKVQPQDTWK